MNTSKTVIVAKVIGMNYTPVGVVSKTGEGNHKNNKSFATASYNHFILRIKVGSEVYDIWVEEVFKKLLHANRLTFKLRQKIFATMPEEVGVVEQCNMPAQPYVLDGAPANAWVLRVYKVI